MRPQAMLPEDTCDRIDRPPVLRVRRSGLPVRTALLGRPGLPLGVLLRRVLRDGHAEAHPHVSALLARPELLHVAQVQGVGITAWTVDRPQDLLRLASAGLSAAICDDPRAAREVLSAGALAATA
jgi:glycerophosphoryl diester phosphodiesterase